MKSDKNYIAEGILKAVFVLFSLGLLVWFLYAILDVIIYLTIGGVVSLMGRPIVKLFERIKLPNLISVILTIILIIILVVFVILMFVPLISDQAQNLSLLDTKGLEKNISNWVLQLDKLLSRYGIEIVKELNESGFLSSFDLKFIPNTLNSIFGILGNAIIGVFSVLFITFFFLLDNSAMTKPFYAVIPDKHESQLRKALIKIRTLLSRYFLGLLLQITILFVFYTLILLIFGVDNLLIIAFLCALLNIIPYVGPLIGGVVMISLTMIGMIGMDFNSEVLPTALYVFLSYLGVQLWDNFVNQPLIFSKSVQSHPLEIFLVILIFGTLFGIMGMIVAVPLHTAIKVILKEFFNEFKWVKMLS